MALTIKVPIAMVRNRFGMEASRLSLLDHGPKSNEIRVNSRMTAYPEVKVDGFHEVQGGREISTPDKRCQLNRSMWPLLTQANLTHRVGRARCFFVLRRSGLTGEGG